MKGYFFRGEPPTRQHLIDDYRDPQLPPLPPVKPLKPLLSACSSLGSLSVANVLSDPWLIDQLQAVGYKEPASASRSVARIAALKKKLARKTDEQREKCQPQLDIHRETETLLDDGYTLAYKVINELLERDSEMLAALKNVLFESVTSRPPLKSSIEGTFIISVLRLWEDVNSKRPKGKSASIMLHLALHFLKKEDPSYYWLVYELFHLALRSNLPRKGNRITEAVICYLFGKFLVEKAVHLKEAEVHLERASRLSCGYNWTTDFITDESDHIYNNSNYLLHVILIHRAFDVSYKKPIEAVNLAKKAVTVVKRANNILALADAYFDLAVAFNRAHMPERSIPIVDKAVEIYESRGDQKNICLSLLFKSQCFRRMKDYTAVLECLGSLVNWARTYNLPSMEAKAYKHLAEYFLDRDKHQAASRYLKKSSSLFEECDLRDELDEVTILLSYTNAWLRLHDVYHLLLKVVSPNEELVFDYVDFVELGVPVYTRWLKLKFVYKKLSSLQPAVELSNKIQDEEEIEDVDDKTDSDSESDAQVAPFANYFTNRHVNAEVTEYFAFSDFGGSIFDEELDQAYKMFEKLNIDVSSDLVVKELKKVPFKNRGSKKSLICLAIEEITAAQKLHCLANGLDDLAVSMDKDRVSKKMRALHQLQADDGGNSDNSNRLWGFTSEIHSFEETSVFTEWLDKALDEAEQLDYTAESTPDIYADLLNALLLLTEIYANFDNYMTAKEAVEEEEESAEMEAEGELEASTQTLPQTPIKIHSEDSFVETVPSAPKPLKVCLCKDPK